MVGNISFYSITYRLFKLPGLLEPNCEDYGQRATYKVRILILFAVSVLLLLQTFGIGVVVLFDLLIQ